MVYIQQGVSCCLILILKRNQVSGSPRGGNFESDRLSQARQIELPKGRVLFLPIVCELSSPPPASDPGAACQTLGGMVIIESH
jgi:hypothetical protein